MNCGLRRVHCGARATADHSANAAAGQVADVTSCFPKVLKAKLARSVVRCAVVSAILP